MKCVSIIFRSLSLSRTQQEAMDESSGNKNSSSNEKDNQIAGADDFLPLFIWVVMNSHIPKLFSNCEYIQSYLNPARLMSKSGYCLINLRSATEFVNYVDSSSLKIDPEEFDRKLAEAEASLGC